MQYGVDPYCCITRLYVLLEALLPVCMKYTAPDESRVANIARVLYLLQDSSRAVRILSYKQSGSVLLYFTLTKVSVP